MIRMLAYAASLLTVVAAAFTVPLPLAITVPGGVTPIADLIVLGDDVEVTPIDGELSLLTVNILQGATTVESLQATLSPAGEVDLTGQVLPAGVDRSDYRRLQRRTFERSFELAVALGLEQAGLEVEVGTAAFVALTLPDGPSDGILEAGDLIRSIDGERVASVDELIAALDGVEVGDQIDITVERGSDRLALTVTAGQVPPMQQPGLGIIPETVADDLQLPVDVSLDEAVRIGGPSAGMMIALASYDLFGEEDLTRGRTIVGTGTVESGGRIGEIDGLTGKVVAAVEEHADLLLVPRSQLDEARAAAPAGLRVEGVGTVTEAIELLRR